MYVWFACGGAGEEEEEDADVHLNSNNPTLKGGKKIHRSVRIEIDVTVSRMSTHKLLILKREDVVATHNTTPVK